MYTLKAFDYVMTDHGYLFRCGDKTLGVVEEFADMCWFFDHNTGKLLGVGSDPGKAVADWLSRQDKLPDSRT